MWSQLWRLCCSFVVDSRWKSLRLSFVGNWNAGTGFCLLPNSSLSPASVDTCRSPRVSRARILTALFLPDRRKTDVRDSRIRCRGGEQASLRGDGERAQSYYVMGTAWS
jgi:hypothetical protein